jgi:hypothetical protein
MAVIKELTIPEANIKTRWEEPYVSSAINRIMSAMPRGVYWGFEVTQKATPGSGIRINILTGRDSFLLHQDIAGGHKTSVRYAADFEVDFTFTVSTDYFVWVDVTYTVSSSTVGSIFVGEAADLAAAPNAVSIGRFNSSDATITNGEIWSSSSSTTAPASPSDFLTPRPDDSEDNPYGFINENEYGRLPTQDQKDAMDGAASPSASNPFATEDGLNKGAFSYVVSDGTVSTDGDFDGVDALILALDAVEGDGGGAIYVRRGNYTLTGAPGKTYTVPIHIYCEGGPATPSGSRCLLTLDHTNSVYGLTFNGSVTIHHLEIVRGAAGTLAVSFKSKVFTENLIVSGGKVQFDGARGRVVGGTTENIVIASMPFPGVRFDGVLFVNKTAGDVAVRFEGVVANASFSSCLMDGSNGDTIDGGGIWADATASIDGILLGECTVSSRGAYRNIHLNEAFSTTVAGVAIRDCTSFIYTGWGSSSSNRQIDIKSIEALKIDGLDVVLLNGDDVESGISYIAGAGSVKAMRIIGFGAAGNQLDHHASAEAAVVFEGVGGTGIDADLNVTNLQALRFRGGNTSLAQSTMVKGNGRCTIDGLMISTLGAGASGAVYFVGYTPGSSTSKLVNSYLIGEDLDNSGSEEYYGVYLGTTGGPTSPEQFTMENNNVSGWQTQDIRILDVDAGIVVDKCNGKGYNGANTPRWFIDVERSRITNCSYHQNSTDSDEWMRLGANAGRSTINGNTGYMTLTASELIYLEDACQDCAVGGNAGRGEISILTADALTTAGIGQSPYTIGANGNTNATEGGVGLR